MDRRDARRSRAGDVLLGGVAGALVAVGAIWLMGDGAGQAGAQRAAGGGVTLTAGQLLINQRISQAAVRRSNEGLRLLDPVRPDARQPGKALGWRGEDLRDGAVSGTKLAPGAVSGPALGEGAVTAAKLAPGAVTTAALGDGAVTRAKVAGDIADRLPLWAVVDQDGTLMRGSPGVAAIRTGIGRYTVDFGRDLRACGFTGTQHMPSLPFLGLVGMDVVPPDVTRLTVRTTDRPTTVNNNALADRRFTVQVTC